ncbi:AI-2E family transporter [Sinorhizobium sp. BG8]|uniref:AI-2E family transporter n=1 Tax=Sinorhizobium sp. BG8 TaxID=2613773 RepID=UPI00193E3AB8|nr:AI-2E family transporter [Sinorhizobium sp. BG8]
MTTGVEKPLGVWAERVVGLLLIGLIILACFWIAWPLMGVLAWGALIAVALFPLSRRLASMIGERTKTASLLIALILLVLVIVPLSYLPGSFNRATEAASALTNDWTELKLPPPPPWISDFPLIGSTIGEKWSRAAEASRNMMASLKPYFGPTVQWLAALGASLGIAVVQMLLAIILAGVFLATQGSTKETFHTIGRRLGGPTGESLVDVAVRTIRSVVQGVMGTALIQSALSGIGFAIAGVPFAVPLGVLCFGTAMLQIGTWLIWIPVALWLSYQGETGWAIFTTVAGIVINILDNVIKPLLIGRGAGSPIWIIFIGVIGGVLTMGIIGIFVGPLVMAIGYSIVGNWLGEQAPVRD